jgi:hypothetical protein
VFYHGELFPGDVAWVGCSHTIPAFPVVLFHYTSGWKFGKDIEQVLSKINVTPTKCLGFKTLAEVFAKCGGVALAS